MGDIERSPVNVVAEFLHTGGPSLNADDAATAIIGALTEAGFEVVPASQLRGAVEALTELVRLKDGPRDDAYRAAKDAAWDTARDVVNRAGGQ